MDTLRAAAAVIGSLKAAAQAEQVSFKHLVGNRGSWAQMWPEWAKWSAGEFRKIPQCLNEQTENGSTWTDFLIDPTFSQYRDILANTVAVPKPGSVFSGQAKTGKKKKKKRKKKLHHQHSHNCKYSYNFKAHKSWKRKTDKDIINLWSYSQQPVSLAYRETEQSILFNPF